MLRLFAHTPERVLPAPTAKLSEAHWPVPFRQGLEYSPPARGPWTIVHVGMLVPECHEIFVCAQGCLRGVVLSAAELGLQRRFSTITVTEEHLRDGQLEDTIIEGVTHILERLPKLPPAVLVYSSCLHHFSGADLGWAYRKLSEAFPDVVFTDCYMTPTLRKSEMPPDNKMRRQLYHGLRPADLPKGGLLVAEYRRMAHARWVVTVNPAALQAGRFLAERHGMRHLQLLLDYNEQRIDDSLGTLAELTGIPLWDTTAEKSAARTALAQAADALAGRPVAICQTATTRPVALARRLVESGIRVTDLYCDSFLPADKTDFEILRKKAPGILVHPTTVPEMRFATPAEKRDDIVAIGQKAAFFTGATHMLNMIEGGPWWGHGGVRSLALALEAAAREPVDVDRIISVKGYGCNGCC